MIFLPNVSLQNFSKSIEVFVTIFVVCWFGWTKYSYHFEFFMFLFFVCSGRLGESGTEWIALGDKE